ncbi:MAG TPA: DUF4244 domain-containing protein [Microbacteriaceae bacterium]|nr:DUF4244 domain-containing protein [Microbacteriaceae bacterium]
MWWSKSATGIVRPRWGGWPRWRGRASWGDDRGATTAEFAIVTMAAVGFAGLLVVILRSDQVRAILEDLVQRALSTGG